jgi:thiamine biosynthesis lipoprotein
VFTHQAMNTTFTIRLLGDSPRYPGIVRECLVLVDDLESRLSRFIETSEISRINRLRAGETLHLTEDTHRCLTLAARASMETGGLFDVTQGRRIALRKGGDPAPPELETGCLFVHPDAPAISCQAPGRQVDLGGIGKGFALDRIRELLLEFEVEGGMLEAGASTLCAFGPEAWPTELSGAAGDRLVLELLDATLSASGTTLQGCHIVHPVADAEISYLSDRVWAVSNSAALADAWSTALMLMTPEQVAICLGGDGSTLRAAYAELDGRIVALGGYSSPPVERSAP